LKIELTRLDYFIEILGILAAILLILLPLYYYNELPERIPRHFNYRGDADAMGPKFMILIFSSIGIGLYLMMSILNKFPHVFNYMVTITRENAFIQYKYAKRLLRMMKVSILFIFIYISAMQIFVVLDMFKGIGIYFLPITLLIVFVPIIIYVVLSVRNR